MPTTNSRALLPSILDTKYVQKVKRFWGSSLISYIPMMEPGGTVVYDESGNGRNGNAAGNNPPIVGGADGPINRTKSVIFGGTANCYISWTSTAAAFNPLEGTVLLDIGGLTNAVWDDGTTDYIFYAFVNASNYHSIYKRSTPIREIVIRQIAGGTSIFRLIPIQNPNWFRLAYTWSDSGDVMRIYINGYQYGADLTGIGTWSGSLTADHPLLGSDFTTAGNPLKANMAHAVLLNRAATAAEIEAEYKLWRIPKVIGVIGDSIAAYSSVTGWAWMFRDQHNVGNNRLINHAVTGHSIISNMDGQTTAAATDNAKIIIIALGTNDNDAGNMTTLQAECEENIIELKGSNPNASLYWMNVLPRWTDVGGGTPVAKDNIRGAIAAACTAQGITCWDTYTDPWITAAQTVDGLHPNDAGHAAILTRVLGYLP